MEKSSKEQIAMRALHTFRKRNYDQKIIKTNLFTPSLKVWRQTEPELDPQWIFNFSCHDISDVFIKTIEHLKKNPTTFIDVYPFETRLHVHFHDCEGLYEELFSIQFYSLEEEEKKENYCIAFEVVDIEEKFPFIYKNCLKEVFGVEVDTKEIENKIEKFVPLEKSELIRIFTTIKNQEYPFLEKKFLRSLLFYCKDENSDFLDLIEISIFLLNLKNLHCHRVAVDSLLYLSKKITLNKDKIYNQVCYIMENSSSRYLKNRSEILHNVLTNNTFSIL